MKIQTTLIVSSLALLTLGTSGCGTTGDQIATDTSELNPTASIRPSPSASAPAQPQPAASASPTPLLDITQNELRDLLPDDVWDNSVEGAEATAHYFASQYSRMYQTGDATRWRALAMSTCDGCASALEGAVELHDRGWGARGGDIVPREDASSIPHSQLFDSGEGAFVSYSATAEDAYTIDEHGEEELTGASAIVQVNVELIQIDDAWRVSSFEVNVSPQ